MDIVVGSNHLAVDTMIGLDVAGREHLVVMAKATWRIPGPGGRPRPLAAQPFVPSDDYMAEPGLSAMRYGSDFVRFKPRCDVLFDARFHSPTGEAVTTDTAAWQVGPLRKALRVHGQRRWRRKLGRLVLSDPEPFVAMPLHYGLAFGGTRTYRKGSGADAVELSEALLSNPAGIGWAGSRTLAQVADEPAPCLTYLDDDIRAPNGKHRPAAFSAIGRHWHPRVTYAGTYDDAWQRDIFPFLPEDYDERFHQCAPEDQQMDYPEGGETVVLRNLMPGRPDVRFALPALGRLPVRVLRKGYRQEILPAVVDTLFFEPDAERFTAVWRVATPLLRRLQEFETVAVGAVNAAWWAAKANGADGSGCKGCGPEELAQWELAVPPTGGLA